MQAELAQTSRMKTYMFLSTIDGIEFVEIERPYNKDIGFILLWSKDRPNLLVCFNMEYMKMNRIIYCDTKRKVIHFFSPRISELAHSGKISSKEQFITTMIELCYNAVRIADGNSNIYNEKHTIFAYYDNFNGDVTNTYYAKELIGHHSLDGDLLVSPIIKYILENIMEA